MTKVGNSSISMRAFIISSSLQGFDPKNRFFEGRSWFKYNKLELTLCTSLKFYTSVAKGLKRKTRKLSELIPTFVEVTGEKLLGRPLWSPSPSSQRVLRCCMGSGYASGLTVYLLNLVFILACFLPCFI